MAHLLGRQVLPHLTARFLFFKAALLGVAILLLPDDELRVWASPATSVFISFTVSYNSTTCVQCQRVTTVRLNWGNVLDVR